MEEPADPLLLGEPPPRQLSFDPDANSTTSTLRGTDEDDETESQGIPASERRGIPRCCCGRPECPFLAHSSVLLEGLEKDVQTAAKMGQALLVRHETYMADATRERTQLTDTIGTLEGAREDLEAQNAATIAENRALLDQLERLNTSAAESDARVQRLTAELSSTREELARALARAKAADELERQVAALEREQAGLVEQVDGAREEGRGALFRWRRAERTIVELSGQIERIEREAREESERHVEVVGRLERRRAVERELDGAAGRLKGAAAAKMASAGGQAEGATSVVSHFVKDILQDNANLQLGIVELRELLMSTNEEVERLRDQLMFHQPVEDLEQAEGHLGDKTQPRYQSPVPSLQKDLGFDQSRKTALHVHHHYHAPSPVRRASSPGAAQQKKSTQRPIRRKRNVVPSTPEPRSRRASFTRPPPPIGLSGPGSRPPAPSSSATILSQTTVTVPQQQRQSQQPRWSIPSALSSATGSLPASPSTISNRASSIMDRVFSDAGLDSSLPTSPEESEAGSPTFGPISLGSKTTVPGALPATPRGNTRRGLCSVGNPVMLLQQPKSVPTTGLSAPQTIKSTPVPLHDSRVSDAELDSLDLRNVSIANTVTTTEAIPEEEPLTPTQDASDDAPNEPGQHAPPPDFNPYPTRLRRAASHESLLSISGMDIHLADTSRFPNSAAWRQHILSPSSAGTAGSGAVLTGGGVTATISGAHGGRGREALADVRASARAGGGNGAPALRHWASRDTLGKKVGGWVFGRWGVGATSASDGPSPSSGAAATGEGSPLRAKSTPTTAKQIASDALRRASAADAGLSPQQHRPRMSKTRTSGVNQRGPVVGLGPEPKAPFKATVERLDVDALQESLGEA